MKIKKKIMLLISSFSLLFFTFSPSILAEQIDANDKIPNNGYIELW
ncbi:hypothetical protein [Aerococcus urinaeequi]